MMVIRKVMAVCFALFSCASFAVQISGPEVDNDGDFIVRWGVIEPGRNCSDLTVTASQGDYTDRFAVESDATEFRFTGLPEGEFTISLTGECELKDAERKVETAIAVTAITIDYDSDNSAASKDLSDILSTKSQRVTGQSNFLRAASGASDAMWRCSSICPSGYHIEWQACNTQIVNENQQLEACANYFGISGCLQTGSTNSVWCEQNDDDFWVCGLSCPSGYNRVDTRSDPTYCSSSLNTESRCVLNTDPPRAVSLQGATTRYDATVQVSWGSVANASYYQWKQSSQSSWTQTSGRSVTMSNLANGTYTVQVRACNSYGCSSTSSRSVTLRSPAAPSITSASTSTTAVYRLTWSSSSGASRYEWRVDAGSWSSTTGTAVNTPEQSLGSHVFYVRACNSVSCGSVASKSVTFQGPAAPAITSSSSNSAQYYTLAWSASPNAARYEWRNGSGSWRSTTGTSAYIALATGANVLSVRACNSLGCGSAASKTVNSTYVHRNTKVFEYNDPAQGNYPKDCSIRQVYSGGGGNTVYTEYRIECPGDVVNVGVAKTWTNNSYYSCSFTTNPSSTYLVQGSCDNWRVYK